MSIDPVTTDANTESSFNRYNYANNNPYKYIDPDGRHLAVIVALKVADAAITGVELYGAWQTGGASSLAVAAGQNYMANLVPGMKTSSFIVKNSGSLMGKIHDKALQTWTSTVSKEQKAAINDFFKGKAPGEEVARDTLEKYQKVAERAVGHGKDKIGESEMN